MPENNLRKLKRRLYKKGEAFKKRKGRVRIYGKKEDIPASSWRSSAPKKPSVFRPLKIIFAIAGLFLFASVSVLLYFWLGEANVISSNNIAIEFRGPAYVRGGEVITIDVFVENKNNTPLETADLIFDFPEGTFSPEGEEMKRARYSFDTIGAWGSIKKTINIALLGTEEEVKKITTTLEYRLAESNAIFAKSADYIVKISQPTVGVSLVVPQNANAGQEIEVEVELVSNAETIIKNLMLQVDYPPGFQFSGAVPEPSARENTWRIGDIAPSSKKNILIRGVVSGQDLEEKAFRASVGSGDDSGNLVSYGSSAETMVVKKSFIDLMVFVNGKDASKPIAFSGDYLRGEIVWKNNLSVPVRNATIKMTLKGAALNEKSVSASSGFYKAFSKTLVWNSSSLPNLAVIDPGEIGRVQFSFSILSPLPIKTADDKNFTVFLDGEIGGRAVLGGSEDSKVSNSIAKEIKIGSALQLASRSMYYSGAFENTGPMPPQAGEETTYTIVWSLGNASNDFSGVKVIAGLPSYVRWLGNFESASADMSFDGIAGEVTWNTGDVPAGTGVTRPAREVSFQVGLTPSVGQIGRAPALVTEVTLEATDDFIGEHLRYIGRALTTRLVNDPQFSNKEADVVE